MSHHRIWSGFVGKDCYEVIDLILKESKGYNPIVVKPSKPGEPIRYITHEYICNRVRIYVNSNNKVIKDPCTG